MYIYIFSAVANLVLNVNIVVGNWLFVSVCEVCLCFSVYIFREAPRLFLFSE